MCSVTVLRLGIIALISMDVGVSKVAFEVNSRSPQVLLDKKIQHGLVAMCACMGTGL